jgi:hypothetical protein
MSAKTIAAIRAREAAKRPAKPKAKPKAVKAKPVEMANG